MGNDTLNIPDNFGRVLEQATEFLEIAIRKAISMREKSGVAADANEFVGVCVHADDPIWGPMTDELGLNLVRDESCGCDCEPLMCFVTALDFLDVVRDVFPEIDLSVTDGLDSNTAIGIVLAYSHCVVIAVPVQRLEMMPMGSMAIN